MSLASRLSKNLTSFRSTVPLTNEQISLYAPSIFAKEKHFSRSNRYTYIPTIEILNGLRKEGFQAYMVCQSRSRDQSKREHTKHLLRLRHASRITRSDANEIILLNSHDGSSAYQMLAGVFRFVCTNGMVCGDTRMDIRVRHSGNVVDNVIEGAFRVLDDFAEVTAQKEGMQSLSLDAGEQAAFAKAALTLRYDTTKCPAPVTESQVLRINRAEDNASDLWTTFNRVQENLVRGGLQGRTATGQERKTRAISSIDQNVKLNRALWVLSNEMRKLKA